MEYLRVVSRFVSIYVMPILESLKEIAPILIATFAFFMWRLNRNQSKMFNDPDIRVNISEPKKWKDLETGYVWEIEMVFINPGSVPIEINGVEYHKNEGWTPVPELKSPPEIRPPEKFIDSWPWVVKKGEYAICRQLVTVRKEANLFKGEIKYVVRHKAKTRPFSVNVEGKKDYPLEFLRPIVEKLVQIERQLKDKFQIYRAVPMSQTKKEYLEVLMEALTELRGFWDLRKDYYIYELFQLTDEISKEIAKALGTIEASAQSLDKKEPDLATLESQNNIIVDVVKKCREFLQKYGHPELYKRANPG